MKIVATGFSGMIGTELAKKLSKKYELVRLVRKISHVSSLPGGEAVWTPADVSDWAKEIDGAHAVINLSGESIAGKRWTPTQKKELISSRLTTTKALVEAIAKAKKKPKVFLSASAIGIYGPRDAAPLSESVDPGSGFLADLCKEWERQALKAQSPETRVVLLRTGIVLGRRGGALAKMLPPFRMGLGGPLGSGQQIMSWIHLQDEVDAIVYALENESIAGPVNLTAPNSVSMKGFAKSLGKALHRPALFPVPAFVLKLLLGEMSEMLLTGQNVKPTKLLDQGYRFRYPDLDGALEDLLR